jgi:hypothetical protein
MAVTSSKPKDYKKKPNYCKVCGTPMEENREHSGFDPQTGKPLKVKITKYCPKSTSHPTWTGVE